MPCDCEKTQKEGNHDCPSGQKYDDKAGKCMPTETFKEDAFGDQKSTDAPQSGEIVSQVMPAQCPQGQSFDNTSKMCLPTNSKDPGDGQTKGTDKTASVESKLNHLTDIIGSMMELQKTKTVEKKPTAQVGSDKTRFLRIDEIAHEYVEALRNYGKYEFNIPLEYFRSITVGNADPKYNVREVYRNSPMPIREAYQSPNKTIKEAVSISGTHATQDLDTDVAIVPGGISFIPVFQFAKVKQIQQGYDRARFFKTTLPANSSQTVGTTATEATQTLTSIEVTPSTITGVYLIGDYDEIENSPFDLLQAIVEGSAASYDDFVATDMLDIVSAQGTLTPGLWIRGDTGATVSTSDTAAVTMDEDGVAFAREYLEDQGYLRGGIKPVMCLHPRQWRELITSTNVVSLATRSVPDIWLKAQLEEFMGVQLVVTNAVQKRTAQTIPAYNALMFIPKHSYGIGIKRDVTIKFHDIGEDNQIRVNTTWRTKSGVLDATSIVRISTTA